MGCACMWGVLVCGVCLCVGCALWGVLVDVGGMCGCALVLWCACVLVGMCVCGV